MTKIKLSAFRRALESRQTELGNGSRNRQALAIETSADELDRIQDASDRDYAMSTLERNFSGLGQASAALRRIDAGTFGICVDCQAEINPKRLAAVPWASHCIACQEATDREQGAATDEMAQPLLMAAWGTVADYFAVKSWDKECSANGHRRKIMLWTIVAVLIILWLLGFSLHIAGGLIHLLLVVAVVVIIFNLLSGRRAV
jgi:DnaK suppressor protein